MEISRRALVCGIGSTISFMALPARKATARTEITQPTMISATPANLQSAINIVCDTLLINNQPVVIQLSPGTYSGNYLLRNWIGSGNVDPTVLSVPQIIGNPSSILNYTFTNALTAVSVNAPWYIDGVTLAGSPYGLVSDFDSTLYLGSIVYKTNSLASIFAEWQSRVEIIRGSVSEIISGPVDSLARVERGGMVLAQSPTSNNSPQMIIAPGSLSRWATQDTAGIVDFTSLQLASGSQNPPQPSVYSDRSLMIGVS